MIHSFQNTESCFHTKPPTIFLPGWAFDGRILQLLKPAPSWIYPENMLDPEIIEQDLLHLLVSKGIKKIRLVGWSMGAMLSMKLAARHSHLIDSLILVSLRSSWPKPEIDAIRAEFSRDPAAFLRGFYRKCFLGDKDAYTHFRDTLEPRYLAEIKKNIDKLEHGLDFLAAFSVPSPLPKTPTMLIHGKQDLIAPVTEIPALPGAGLEIVDNAGHAPFLHESCSLQHEFKKQEILAKFSRAANSYDNYAKVQTEVARRLAAKLPEALKKPEIKTILEIGCGTGNFTSLLAAEFPTAKIVALDFSPEMIAIACKKQTKPYIEFICAEGEFFLQNALKKSFDLVVSNGAMQWFSNINKSLHNISRILTPGGSMYCSIFGPESLNELGEGLHAIQTLKESLAAQSFPRPDELRKVLHDNFLHSAVVEEYIEKEYRSAHDLLLHIKKTGTAGWKHKTRQPLTSSRVNLLNEWFTKTYGSCKVTYQVFFLEGKNS